MMHRRLFSLIVLAASLPAIAGAQAPSPTGLVLLTPGELASVAPAFLPFSGGDLPKRFDLSPHMPPPGHQGQQGSCTAWTVAYGMRSYQAGVRAGKPFVTASGRVDSTMVFSPAFIYNQSNKDKAIPTGVSFQYALDLLVKQGVAPLSAMPYIDTIWTRQPDDSVRKIASNYRLLSWRRLNPRDGEEIKSQLVAGYPVMIAAIIDSNFDSHPKPGFIWRDSAGVSRGPHAMNVVGYDDARSAFKVMNSWGRNWADSGFIWVDYKFFPRTVREAYVAKDLFLPPDTGRKSNTTTLDPAAVFDSAKVQVVRIKENVTEPGLGAGIRIDGIVNVPPGGVGQLQVVLQFYQDAGGGKKGKYIATKEQRFRVGKDRVATGTRPFDLPVTGLNRAWYAFLPYSALDLSNIPQALYGTKLVMEPVLYVDRFGVKAGATSALTCACGR